MNHSLWFGQLVANFKYKKNKKLNYWRKRNNIIKDNIILYNKI